MAVALLGGVISAGLARASADGVIPLGAASVDAVFDEGVAIAPPSLAFPDVPNACDQITNLCQEPQYVLSKTKSPVFVPGKGIVAGTTVVHVPQTLVVTYHDRAGTTIGSTTTRGYNTTTDTSTMSETAMPAADASSGATSTSYPCYYDNDYNNVIVYDSFAAGGQANGASVKYIVYPYGLNYARNTASGETWQIEACASGGGNGGTDYMTRAGISIAETTTSNTLVGYTGDTGCYGGQSSDTTYGFQIQGGSGDTTGDIHASVTNHTCGSDYIYNGANGVVSVPLDNNPNNEVSSFWDDSGSSNATTDPVASAGHGLWEFPESDNSTKYIGADAFMQYCTSNVCYTGP